jgi:hypothetical protein
MTLVDSQVTVPALTKFKGKDDFGNDVQSAPAEAPVPAEVAKYYLCTHPAASFHRKDGKRISFVQGFFKADLKPDQNYLDGEIADGNPYISLANEDQIKIINMKINPRKTIEDELRPQIEAETEAKLRDKLRAELLAELTGQSSAVTDAQRLAGTANAGDSKAGQIAGTGLTLTPLTGLTVPRLTPVSTASIADAAAGSGGNG